MVTAFHWQHLNPKNLVEVSSLQTRANKRVPELVLQKIFSQEQNS
jgi:hypothetical protein